MDTNREISASTRETSIIPTRESAAALLASSEVMSSQSLTGTANSNLTINVKNGVATLSGNTDTQADANMVEYLVSRMKGVNHIINLIIQK